MGRAGDNGGVYHQLDESQRLFLDAWTTQMQHLLNRNKEKPYRRIAKSSSFTLKPLSPRGRERIHENRYESVHLSFTR